MDTSEDTTTKDMDSGSESAATTDSDTTMTNEQENENEIENEDENGIELTAEERKASADAFKAEGNEHFKAGQNSDALACYQQGLRYAARLKEEPQGCELLASLHTNMAATHNRLEAWADAVASATSALELDAANLKALFRPVAMGRPDNELIAQVYLQAEGFAHARDLAACIRAASVRGRFPTNFRNDDGRR